MNDSIPSVSSSGNTVSESTPSVNSGSFSKTWMASDPSAKGNAPSLVRKPFEDFAPLQNIHTFRCLSENEYISLQKIAKSCGYVPHLWVAFRGQAVHAEAKSPHALYDDLLKSYRGDIPLDVSIIRVDEPYNVSTHFCSSIPALRSQHVLHSQPTLHTENKYCNPFAALSESQYVDLQKRVVLAGFPGGMWLGLLHDKVLYYSHFNGQEVLNKILSCHNGTIPSGMSIIQVDLPYRKSTHSQCSVDTPCPKKLSDNEAMEDILKTGIECDTQNPLHDGSGMKVASQLIEQIKEAKVARDRIPFVIDKCSACSQKKTCIVVKDDIPRFFCRSCVEIAFINCG